MPDLTFVVRQTAVDNRFVYFKPEDESGYYLWERPSLPDEQWSEDRYAQEVTELAQQLKVVTDERDSAAANLKELEDQGAPQPPVCFDVRSGADPITDFLDAEWTYYDALERAQDRNATAISAYNATYASVLATFKLITRSEWCHLVSLSNLPYRFTYFAQSADGEAVTLVRT
jgi:hypothetical protein